MGPSAIPLYTLVEAGYDTFIPDDRFVASAASADGGRRDDAVRKMDGDEPVTEPRHPTVKKNLSITALCLLAGSPVLLGCGKGERVAPDAPESPVGNRAPVAVEAIPPAFVGGGGADVAVSPYFRDPDGDTLTFTAEWEHDQSPLGVSPLGTFVEIVPGSPGGRAVSVTAADPSGLTAEQVFDIGIPPPPTLPPLINPNRPRPIKSILPTQLRVGERTTINLADYFYLPWPRAWRITSSSPAVVATSVSGDTLTLEGTGLGPTQVLATVTEIGVPHGLSGSQEFDVVVVSPTAPPNNWPVPFVCPRDKLIPWHTTLLHDVSAYFTEPDGDPLTYTARSEDPVIVVASISGSILTLWGRGVSTGTHVAVTAHDPGGLFADVSFQVRRAGSQATGRRPCRFEQDP